MRGIAAVFKSGEAKAKKTYYQKKSVRPCAVTSRHITVMDALKEYLEELMDLKRTATIRFRPVDGGVSIVRAHIVKLDTVSGRQIIETDAGLVIGADQILEINGRRFENNC